MKKKKKIIITIPKYPIYNSIGRALYYRHNLYGYTIKKKLQNKIHFNAKFLEFYIFNTL